MFIRLSRYVILGMIISLITFLVTQNNKEKVKMETILLIGVISAIIIFAISFRVEFYENVDNSGTEVPTVITPPVKPVEQEQGVLINERERLRKMAIEIIRMMDKEGTEDDEELMKKVEDALRTELNKTKIPEGEMAEKVAERVMNPKLDDEMPVQTKPKENRLSMQYEQAINEVIKEKIREQLYSDEVINRAKESDYTIMPVSEWSLPLEKRKYQCIPKKETEVCDCQTGSSSDFWGGQFMKIKGAPELPPAPKKEVEI